MAPPKPTERETPMQVLNFGLCRTGTTSTRLALLELGYGNVHHMVTVGKNAPWEPVMWVDAIEAKFGGKGKPFGKEEFDILLSRYNGVCDVPAAAFPEELMLAYPDAKLIMTVRDSPDAWIGSMADSLWHFKRLLSSNLDPLTAFLKALAPLGVPVNVPLACFKYNVMGGAELSTEANRKVYLDHNENVKQLAKKHGRELLVFNVKQGWGPLCAFLGKEVPKGPYPRVNEKAQMTQYVRQVKTTQAIMNTIVFGGSAALMAWVAYGAAMKRNWI